MKDYTALIEAENRDNAEMGKKNLFFLSRYLLHYELVDEFHKPLCKEIESVGGEFPKQRLWLWARGHLKTTLITIAHTIQLILNNPNIRILIAHNKLENAKGVLFQIKWHFMNNRSFRRTYPEFCPEANKDGKIEWGTTEHVTVPNRTKNFTEPTIDTAGVDTTKTGRHYDYMKKDDIVWEKSVTNEEQLEATRRWDALTIPMFDNAERAMQDYIGTRYHWADIYSSLLESPDIKKSFMPAWDEEGVVLWKEQYTREGLEKILNSKNMNPYVFYCQYLLQPNDPKNRIFKEEWLVSRDFPSNPSWIYYICVDPAGEKKKTSDYSVMLVIGVDEKGKWHLVDGLRDKLHLHERISKLKGLVEKWKPFRVSYERVGMQADFQELERLKKDGKFPFVSIEERKPSPQETKKDRIMGLCGRFSSAFITIPKELHYYSDYHKKRIDLIQEFKYEFLQFPKAPHDDILDTLAQMLKMNIIKGEMKEEVKETPKGETFMDVFNKIQKANDLIRRFPNAAFQDVMSEVYK